MHQPLIYLHKLLTNIHKATLVRKSSGSLSLKLIYDKNKVVLLDKNFYSGCIPSLIEIEENNNNYNEDNQIEILKFCKTSFAYEDALDNPRFINHPALTSYKEAILDFFIYEHELEEKTVFQKAGNDDEYLNLVSDYLRKSFYHRSIGVSSNIVTSDDKLLFSLRKKGVADSGAVYCSVNGHAEINDPNVRFYQESVYEDLPTISLNSTRIDFEHEIQRESVAELSVSLSNKGYSYYGLSVIGSNKDVERQIEDIRPYSHRLQFNILSLHGCNETLSETIKKQKDATEAYENEQIYGLTVRVPSAKNAKKVFKIGKDNVNITLSLAGAVLALSTASTALAVIESAWKILLGCISAVLFIYSLYSLVKQNIAMRKDNVKLSINRKELKSIYHGCSVKEFERFYNNIRYDFIKKMRKKNASISINPLAEILLLMYFAYWDKK